LVFLAFRNASARHWRMTIEKTNSRRRIRGVYGMSSVRLLLLATALTATGTAKAALITTYTYTFNGYGTGGSGAYSNFNDQDYVSGTYTFVDITNPTVEGQATVNGTVGEQNTTWAVSSAGISLMSASVSSSLFTYNSLVPAGGNYAGAGSTVVQGYPEAGGDDGNYFTASEGNFTGTSGSELLIYSCAPNCPDGSPSYPYTAIGQPQGSTETSGAQYLDYDMQGWVAFANGQANYHIENFYLTSVSTVPIPAAAWLMLSGLGGLAMMLRQRKAA
jgi:hypothetical protein